MFDLRCNSSILGILYTSSFGWFERFSETKAMIDIIYSSPTMVSPDQLQVPEITIDEILINTNMFCYKYNSYQFQSRDTICLYYVKLICYWKWETFSCPSGTCREGHEQPVSLSSPSLLVIPNHPSNIIKNLNPPGGKILKINLCLLYLTKILWCNHIWPYTLPFNSA